MSLIQRGFSLSLKSKTIPAEKRALEGVFQSLGLEGHLAKPLDLAAMLEISTWNPEDSPPLASTDLPHAFLRRLWLLSPQARSTCCQAQTEPAGAQGEGTVPVLGESSNCPINPLDLVTAVYIAADCFLRQEMTVRMVQCGFAVPLLLPPGGPGEQASLLLWHLRVVAKDWRSYSPAGPGSLIEGYMANTQMPLLSFVRLGRCGVSKSQVLNHILSGFQEPGHCFLHRGIEGGQVPRKLSDGLVEVSWYVPSGNPELDIFPEPAMVANLRGDITTSPGTYKKQLSFLCLNSSALFVFCGDLGDRERLLLSSWRSTTNQVFLIMEEEEEEQRARVKKLPEDLSDVTVLSWSKRDGAEVVASKLSAAVNQLLQDSLQPMTLMKAADTALELSIAVDEAEACRVAMRRVEEVLRGVEKQEISSYREEQLPLQGQLWKRLVGLEKQECRLKVPEEASQEQQKQELLREKENLQQREYRTPMAMRAFIAALSTPDKLERACFLSLMRQRLDSMSQWRNSPMSQPITEKHRATAIGVTEGVPENTDKDLERKQPGSSLRLEHFIREMALIFELISVSPDSDSDEVLRLPAVAADLLLSGLPLELLDGDASTISPHWVGSVLSEVHKRLPQDSQVRVLTVLGLNTSRNAAVLSALLGVTFPIRGTQNIKGAYMLLIRVADSLTQDLACNFLLLINTEGLKSPGTGLDEDLDMHDNELATFAMGLSDVTLLNVPAEGETEIQNTLHITVNALLRVMETRRMPALQVVTQGNSFDTKILLLQLDQVTQILAAGEKNQTTPDVTSLQKCESPGRCLQGPWQNTHPMAPVSSGYSEAVMTLKQDLLATLREHAVKTPTASLLDFTERVRSLWETILYEKLPFTMTNTEVGEAFCRLCSEFSQQVHVFREHMESWVEGADERILAFNEATIKKEDEDSHQSLEDLFNGLKMEAAAEVETEANRVLFKLEECFKNSDIHFSLLERYRANFTSSVGTLKERVTHEVNDKIDTAVERNEAATKTRIFQTELAAALEERMQSILEQNKTGNAILEDKQLEEEFSQVWSETISKVDVKPLETQDVTNQVLQQLRENLSNRNVKKHLEKLAEVTTNEASAFTVDEEHFGYRSRLKQMFTEENITRAQGLANRIIENCKNYVSSKKSLNTGYLDSYTKELLEIVDRTLESKQFDIRSRFEVELKVYICSMAVRSFQEMHESFTREKDPLTYLEKARDQLFWEFLYQYRKRDQCQKTARLFTSLCLKPAVLDYVYGPLGSVIQEQMLSGDEGQHYRSPQAYQFHLLRELLFEDSFESFLEYLLCRESFIRTKIQDQVVSHLSRTGMLKRWRQNRLEHISEKMEEAVRQSGNGRNGSQTSARLLLEKVCDSLEESGDMTVRRDALQGPLFQIVTSGDRFIDCLGESLAEMLQALRREFYQVNNSSEAIADTLKALPGTAHDELFLKVRGCEERCPFCKAPCEAVEGEHTVHRALLHRPKGLVSYSCTTSASLSHNDCPVDIAGDNLFQNRDTDGQSLRYRDYRTAYPNWSIPAADASGHTATAYWRYVMARYNNRFAQEYKCEPAQLPEDWAAITQEAAVQSLREAFCTGGTDIKLQFPEPPTPS